jgi:hypothetical protein
MPKPIEINNDLYCPVCGNRGMKALKHKAGSGRTRLRCPSCKTRTTTRLYDAPQILPETKASEIKKHKRFLIASATNDVQIVTGWHQTLKAMADDLDACYLLIPARYRNPDLFHQGIQRSMRWPVEIVPYICNKDVRLNKNLVIRGNTHINYTNINPLAGMNNAAGIQSEIYGHPQVAMEMVPTSKHVLPKMIRTTGSISKKGYGGSPRAQKAAFHHSLSAVFIEVEGDSYWTTEVHYDGHGAYLFDKYYTPDGCDGESYRPEAIVYGDIHIAEVKPRNRRLLDQVTRALQPVNQVYHDLHNHSAHSHHHAKDKLWQLTHQDQDIRKELMQSVRFLDKQEAHCLVISSNHHDHLAQWFNRFRPERDPVNIDLYYELGELARTNNSRDLFRLFVERYAKNVPEFVNGNQLREIASIDVSQHGHRGPNGTKGSGKAFARTGHKTMTGHPHTPGIYKGCYQVGTAELEHDYAVGYSSWMITHGLIYANGKRGLVSAVKGKLSPMMRELASQ